LEHLKEFAIHCKSYRDRNSIYVCLIEISTKSEGDYLIDTLTLSSKLFLLNSSLSNPAILKIVYDSHATSNTLLLFGITLTKTFDCLCIARTLSTVFFSQFFISYSLSYFFLPLAFFIFTALVPGGGQRRKIFSHRISFFFFIFLENLIVYWMENRLL